jgi:mannose-6-phosphate isomerase-like protein (cupin superfamily)
VAERPRPFVSGHADGELLRFGNVTILVRASAAATGGAFSLVEEVPPLVDTPLHVHEHDDELFHVLEGRHVFTVGGEELAAGPGDVVFAPRGVPHAQRRVVPGQGRHVVLTVPGGLDGFFRELAEADAAGELDAERRAAVSARYGITWLG